MATHQQKLNDQNHTIDSEVPGSQALRRAPSINDEEFPGNTTVLTVTKTETSFTKGDSRLQKVTVTEKDIYATPDNEDIEKISRIPITNKFKPIAKKITYERRKSRENIEESRLQSLMRTLRKPSELRTILPKEVTSNQNESLNSKRVSKTEEEFDKIFEEIVNDQEPIVLDESIIEETNLDPYIVETSFEEIVKAKMEPINIENVSPKSRIPLNRHKSYDGSKILASSEKRRHSLKDNMSGNIQPTVPSGKTDTIQILNKNDRLSFTEEKTKSSKSVTVTKIPTSLFAKWEHSENNSKIKDGVNKILSKDSDLVKKSEQEVDDIKTGIERRTSLVDLRNNYNEMLNAGVVPKPAVRHTLESRDNDDKTKMKIAFNNDFDSGLNNLGSKTINDNKSLSKGPEYNHESRKLSISEAEKEKSLSSNSKSVLSKITLFECQSQESYKSPKSKSQQKSYELVNKSKTVHHLNIKDGTEPNLDAEMTKELKTPSYFKMRLDHKSSHFDKIPELNASLTNKKVIDETLEEIEKNEDDIIQNEKTKELIESNNINLIKNKTSSGVINDVKTQNKYKSYSFDKIKPVSVISIKQMFEEKHVKINSKTRVSGTEITKIKSKTENLKTEETPIVTGNRLDEQKSIVNGKKEIGQITKGKISETIQKMVEKQHAAGKKGILDAELTKSRTVTDKIALFEGRSSFKMENREMRSPSTSPRGIGEPKRPLQNITSILNIHTSPDGATNNNVTADSQDGDEPVVQDQELLRKIYELRNAKTEYGVVDRMPTIELKTGQQMPVLALGTALLEPELVRHIVEAAIDLGYRAIDTAYIYGNEAAVGAAIRNKILDGTVKREDLFIMSKLWSTFHRTDLVEQSCCSSLETLGIAYLDLLMIHTPMSFKEGPDPVPTIANVLQHSQYDYMDAWRGMEGLVRKGLVRAIGLSNFNSHQVARVVEKGAIKPVVNQVECHPYLNQERLSEFCNNLDIKMICYGTLGSKGTPAELKSPESAVVIDDPVVKSIAEALEISVSTLLLRYQLDRGHGVVVKSSQPRNLWSNLKALNNSQLPEEYIQKLNALNKNKRNFAFIGMGDTHKNYPFNVEF